MALLHLGADLALFASYAQRGAEGKPYEVAAKSRQNDVHAAHM
jgi:hypothetical protein